MQDPNKPKPRRRSKAEPKPEVAVEQTTEQTASERYMASEPQKYKPPEHMVPLNDDRYMKKDRIGKVKAIRAPGTPVTRVGLGGLKVIHQNPIDYHGNIDV